MTYTVAFCQVIQIVHWRGGDHLEVLCRVTEDLQWLRTLRVNVPYPAHRGELEHDLMCELDVSNVRIQYNLFISIPERWRPGDD